MGKLSILLLLGLAAYCVGETCPPKEKLIPCECTTGYDGHIEVICKSDYDGWKYTLKNLKEAMKSLVGREDVQIKLENIMIGKMPSNFFEGIGVTNLNIWNCDLESFADEGKPALVGLEDSLEELVFLLSFKNNPDLSKWRLERMRKLKYLTLSANAIEEVRNDFLDKGPYTLEHLFVFNNNITVLGDKGFANLRNLKEVFLNGNRFGPIKRSMLPSLADHLQHLDLSDNHFINLPEDLFSNMPALRIIEMESNGIARMERETWEPVWEQLEGVYVSDNPLECDSHMSWMFDLRMPSSVSGTCASPKENERMELRHFISSKGE